MTPALWQAWATWVVVPGLGFGGGVDEFEGQHGAAASDLAHGRALRGECVECGCGDCFDAACRAGEVVVAHRGDGGQCGGAGDGVTAVGAAQPAGVDGVHQVCAAGEAGQGQATGDAFRGGDQVWDDFLVVAGEPVTGAAEPGLNLVGDQEHAALGAPLGDRGEEAGSGHDEPPSPWIGSITTQATWSAPTCWSMSARALAAACSPLIPGGSRNG